jgi:hypothetical protein
MERVRIGEINSTFDEVYDWLKQSGEKHLSTTGNKEFTASADLTIDGRKFLSFPHSNRAYREDWGFRKNSMGRDGQRIGQYCVPLHRAFLSEADSAPEQD